MANDGLILGLYGDSSSNDMSPQDAYDTQAGYGLKGTHLSGKKSLFNNSYTPFTAEIDLETMKVTSTKHYDQQTCTWLY